MDPEQTEQSDLGSHCLSKRLHKHFSRGEKQTTFVAIGALRAIITAADYQFCKMLDWSGLTFHLN